MTRCWPSALLDPITHPRHDDAIAMVVAARHTNLLGITTVAGNAPNRFDLHFDWRALGTTGANAQAVAEYVIATAMLYLGKVLFVPLAAIRNAVTLATRSGTREDLEWSRDVTARQVKNFAHLIDDLALDRLDVNDFPFDDVAVHHLALDNPGGVKAISEAS